MGVTYAEPLQTAAGTQGEGSLPFQYSLYGLRVHSQVPLPAASAPSTVLAAPDVVIRRLAAPCPTVLDGPAAAQMSCPVHGTHMREYRRPDGVWIWLHDIGTFHISADAARVDVYADERVDEQALGLALAGPVLVFARHRLGCPSLHASAVVTARGALAFLGPRGRGKSTMAASFMQRGALLLSDDALSLLLRDDRIVAAPGPPFMKLWRETARQTLELADELPNLMASVEKKLLTLNGRYAFAQTPARLHALYLLDRYDPVAADRADVTIRPLGRRDALVALLAHTANRPYLLPGDEALCLQTYARLLAQAPAHVLTYPDGFAHQDAVCARILQTLEER